MAAHLLTLDQLIVEACEQFAPTDAPTRYHAAALPYAKAFRRKLITSTSRENRAGLLEIGNDRTADLPDDYVEYVRLGVLSDDGQAIYTLAYADVGLPGAPALNAAAYPHDWMGEGGFRIDLATRRVVCNSLVPEHTLLVLEYKSFSAKDGEDIAIDPLAHTWGVKYILAELHNQKQNWQAAAKAEQARDTEFRLYEQAIRNFTLAGVRHINHRAAAQLWK